MSNNITSKSFRQQHPKVAFYRSFEEPRTRPGTQEPGQCDKVTTKAVRVLVHRDGEINSPEANEKMDKIVFNEDQQKYRWLTNSRRWAGPNQMYARVDTFVKPAQTVKEFEKQFGDDLVSVSFKLEKKPGCK